MKRKILREMHSRARDYAKNYQHRATIEDIMVLAKFFSISWHNINFSLDANAALYFAPVEENLHYAGMGHALDVLFYRQRYLRACAEKIDIVTPLLTAMNWQLRRYALFTYSRVHIFDGAVPHFLLEAVAADVILNYKGDSQRNTFYYLGIWKNQNWMYPWTFP